MVEEREAQLHSSVCRRSDCQYSDDQWTADLNPRTGRQQPSQRLMLTASKKDRSRERSGLLPDHSQRSDFRVLLKHTQHLAALVSFDQCGC